MRQYATGAVVLDRGFGAIAGTSSVQETQSLVLSFKSGEPHEIRVQLQDLGEVLFALNSFLQQYASGAAALRSTEGDESYAT